jgi:hypothetical protein
MPRIASVIVLAAATLTANARDFITRISDTAWSINSGVRSTPATARR